jgi:membrane associated rhomboid family serine protease
LFFPYRAQIALQRFPVITVLVSLLCIAVYAAQFQNQRAIIGSTVSFCEKQQDREFKQMMARLTGSSDPVSCMRLMFSLYQSKNDKEEIARLAQRARDIKGVVNAEQHAYYADILTGAYQSYRRTLPSNLTARLWYQPDSWNVLRMLSAAVSHGSWGHLIGNLFFFFAFAATVEILIGPILYIGVLIMLALGTHLVYSIAMLGRPEALPTLGLSGVVMGVIALFTYFIPTAKIRCFLWLVIFFRRFGVPAWLLATWYIGWDLYAQLTGANGGVNVIAHLSGAAIGLGMGVLFFRAKRHWARELVETDVTA